MKLEYYYYFLFQVINKHLERMTMRIHASTTFKKQKNKKNVFFTVFFQATKQAEYDDDDANVMKTGMYIFAKKSGQIQNENYFGKI